MKKAIAIFIILTVIFIFAPRTYAEEYTETNNPLSDIGAGNELIDSLDESTRDSLGTLGITSANAEEISRLDINSIISLVGEMIAEKAGAPLRAFASILGIILIFSVIDTLKDGLTTSSMREVIKIVSVLSVSFILILPVTQFIENAVSSISASAKFMLAYIPAITGILIASGNILTSGSYYALMVFACQAVAQLCSAVISPLLNIFFGLSIAGAVCPVFRLDGICKSISKFIKWALGFAMTLFSATLTFKTMITTVADSVSTRAVRFSLSSFIPIVGSSLSEAYKTIQSSVRLLKSGIGIFAIIAVIIVFLPSIVQGLLWLISIDLCKGAAQILTQDSACAVLEASAAVISTTLVIILCITAVFVISTTVLLMAGGA